jgi:hypothetical protein
MGMRIRILYLWAGRGYGVFVRWVPGYEAGKEPQVPGLSRNTGPLDREKNRSPHPAAGVLPEPGRQGTGEKRTGKVPGIFIKSKNYSDVRINDADAVPQKTDPV